MHRAVAVGAALLVLAACSSSGEGEGQGSSATASGSIELQVSGDPEETIVYESLVKSFEEANPDVDVKLIPVADKDDHLAKLATSLSQGTAPDVFLVNFREFSQFAARGALEPIEDHLDDAGISLDDYYDQPVEAFHFAQELHCMPQNISSLVVYYNTRLFKQAGVKPPEEGWSWEDFRQTAIQLTGDDVRGAGIEPSIIRLAPFVWSNGGEITDDPEQPTTFTLDDPAAREALEFFVKLVREDEVVPTEKEVTAAEDLETMFAQGKLGMLLSSRRDTPEFREVQELKWDVASLPVAEEPAGILHSDAYCIAKEGSDLDASLALISFAVGDRGQTITSLAGRTVPALKEVATSGAFLNPVERPRNSQVFLDAIPNIRATPVIPTWPEIEDVAEEILTRAFYEQDYTVDDAISDLTEQTSPLFEEAAVE